MGRKALIRELKNLIDEAETTPVYFDYRNWPKYQKPCIAWGDKVAPLLKADDVHYRPFVSELDRLRPVPEDPVIPSDFTNDRLKQAFERMISEAKQTLYELERNVHKSISAPDKLTLGWVLQNATLSFWATVFTVFAAIFAAGVFVGQIKLYQEQVARQSRPSPEKSASPISIEAAQKSAEGARNQPAASISNRKGGSRATTDLQK